jgi:DHA1 family multidrug resistance protein-like MFS transporter
MAPSSQTTSRRQVALLALTLGVVMLGFGIVIPVYPFYIQSMGASGNELGLLITISFFILPNALLRVTVVSLTSQRTEMGQGATMGLSNSFTSLGRIVGPVLAGYSYDVDMTYPFWIGAAAMLVGFVISLLWMRPEQQRGTMAAT